MDLEIILNKISSPEEFPTALDTLKMVHMKKISCNILKLLQKVVQINNKDLQQFNGIIVVYNVLDGCLKYEFTDADWLKLHEEFAKSVIIIYKCILLYKDTRFLKEDTFCSVILQLSKLVFPIVFKVDSVRSFVLNGGYNVILSLICLNELKFTIRKEIFPLLKPILVKTNIEERKLIVKSSASLLSSMAKLIIDCGDYETQEGLVEILMRFSCVSKHKLNTVCLWFQEYINDLNLIKILDYSNFDLSCREFLNTLNSANLSKVKVITLPCLEAYANDLHLKKPNKEQYRELWVDFSIATGIVHLVCDSDENVWLRLIISQHNVKKIICSKRVMKGAGAVQFLFELIYPLQVKTSSFEKYVASLSLIFLQSPKIVELKEDFFHTCYKDVFEEERPKLSLLNSSCLKNTEWGREAETPCAHDCFCDGANSISSIHPPSDKLKYHRRGGGNSPARLHSLATSTPKAPLHVSHSSEDKENSGKWQKASLIRYNKYPCIQEEDRKFKQMCDERIAMIKSQLSNSVQSESHSQSNKLNDEKVLETKKQQGKNLINKIGLEYANKKPRLSTLNAVESKKDSYANDLKTLSAESKLSEECSPFALTINKTSKPESSGNSIFKGQQMSLNQTELGNSKKEKDYSCDHSKYRNMKTLFTDKKYHNDRLGLQHSNKPSPLSISNLKLPPLKKTSNFFLQPPKLHISKPNSEVKPMNKFDFSSISNMNDNITDGFQNWSKKGNNTAEPNNLSTKKYFSEGNRIKDPSHNLFLSSLGKVDKVNNFNDRKREPVAKKIKMTESLSPFKNVEIQSKNISNVTCKTKTNLSETAKNNSEGGNIETSSVLSIASEVNTNISEKIPSHLSKNVKMGTITLTKIRESAEKNKSLDVYDWNSSKSYTDNEGSLFTSFKLNRSADKPLTKEPSNENKSLKEGVKQMVGRHLNSQLNIKEPKLGTSESSTSDLSNQKDSLNASIHCKIPAKTYGLTNTKVNLESTPEKIFENMIQNVNKDKRKKRKLFNSNTDFIGGSFEEKKDDVSNATVTLIENIQTNYFTSRNLKKQQSKTVKLKEPEVSKDLSPADGKIPELNRRRSLRPRVVKKYTEVSTESTSSCGTHKVGVTGPKSGKSAKKGSISSVDKESKLSAGQDLLPDSNKTNAEQRLQLSTNKPENKKNNKFQESSSEGHDNSSCESSILQEVHTAGCNSNNKTTFLSTNTKKKDSKRLESSRPVKPEIFDKIGAVIRRSTRRNTTPSKMAEPEKNALNDFDNLARKRKRKNKSSSSSDNEIEEGTRKDVQHVNVIEQSSALVEHNLDPLREESNCDLSLQGIPVEEAKSDENDLELVTPPFRLSTDNSDNGPSTSGQHLQRESSLGTQEEARDELAFLDNVISELEKLSVGNPRKKILTEVVSMDKALKKMELFTKTSDKDLKKSILAMKNSMETLMSSYEDFTTKLATKTTDVISIMTRLSEDIKTDQDSRLKFLQDLEKLCRERRNNVREDKFI